MQLQFPRLVYMSAAAHLLVNNSSEYAEALRAGYYGTVPEALAKKHAPAPAPVDTSVMVYKGREKHRAKDQTEADALVAGDGWHFTEADALRAVVIVDGDYVAPNEPPANKGDAKKK